MDRPAATRQPLRHARRADLSFWHALIPVKMNRYDAIVLGVGGVGSAALWHLARRGVHVLGLDRFPPGHRRGSSHGSTRIIRQAYFEHPDYVPLVRRSYELWEELSQRRGERLYHQVGLLQVGPPEGEIVRGVRASATQHQLAIDELSPAEAMRRWPGFRIPESSTALFEHRAGYLHVEQCVRAHAEEAIAAGAELRLGVSVLQWRRQPDYYVVQTSAGEVTAERLVVAGGAWNRELLADLNLKLTVRRKHQYWFRAATLSYAAAAECPAYLFETANGKFYGFPQIDDAGVKVAEHTGGEEVANPLQRDAGIDAADRRRVEGFCREHLPDLSSELLRHEPCLYTLSADEHFIVDRHPQLPGLALAAGLSGHGFKFAAVLGEVLAEFVMDGKASLPVAFLGLGRAGLVSGEG
jgi:monomeric sarcosine oxidase